MRDELDEMVGSLRIRCATAVRRARDGSELLRIEPGDLLVSIDGFEVPARTVLRKAYRAHVARVIAPTAEEPEGTLELVRAEVGAAIRAFGPTYSSAHEAYGVLLEEVDEFREEVWRKRHQRSKQKMIHELVQVAAVAVKYAAQLRDELNGGEA